MIQNKKNQEQPKQENIQVPAAQVNDAISKTSEKMLQDGIESDWVALGAFSFWKECSNRDEIKLC